MKPKILKLNIKKSYNLKPIEKFPIKVYKTSPLTNASAQARFESNEDIKSKNINDDDSSE